MRATVLICTHNRAELLERALASINCARRSPEYGVEILVIANACTDSTDEFLRSYQQVAASRDWLPLRWEVEPEPGKSRALNRAIPLVRAPLVAVVDDDQRVDPAFFKAIFRATASYPEFSIFCGRLVPDWEGREPAWVHDTGPYRIRPLPVPGSRRGDIVKELTLVDPLPAGGIIFLRREVFNRVGGFSPDLGPHGDDLGGGEDIEFLERALARGERLLYVPDVVQYHYVDRRRFRLGHLLRKAYQRARSGVLRSNLDGIPRWMWRKLAEDLSRAVISASWTRTRFYLVRAAATLGEIRGIRAKAEAVRHGTPWVAPVAGEDLSSPAARGSTSPPYTEGER